MPQSSWAQEAINRFFEGRVHPSQKWCDEKAKSLVRDTWVVRPVDTPGSMSYTVICMENPVEGTVVSFREPWAMLDEEMVRLAMEIHGDLVPEADYRGKVEGASPPLHIYSMDYIYGASCIEVLSSEVDMNSDDEAKHKVFIQHLARYFARCWSSPQPLDHHKKAERQEGVRRRLARLEEHPSPSILPTSLLPRLMETLPTLFSEDYPQVLTHGDLSVTNILLHWRKFEITGIVDWSLATIMPFGMDLGTLFLTTGFMTLDGWHDYACKQSLQDTFWDEFWAASGIEDERRNKIQRLAEAAGQIGAILRLAFRRNMNGSPSEEILVSESSMKQLRAWFR